jgi:hypothetical protein
MVRSASTPVIVHRNIDRPAMLSRDASTRPWSRWTMGSGATVAPYAISARFDGEREQSPPTHTTTMLNPAPDSDIAELVKRLLAKLSTIRNAPDLKPIADKTVEPIQS